MTFVSGPGRVYVDGVYIGDTSDLDIDVEYEHIFDGFNRPIRTGEWRTAHLQIPLRGEIFTRPSFDDYFIGFAVAASARAECSRRKVGAVVVKNKRVIGTGYNGAYKGAEKTCLTGDCPRAQSSVSPGSSYDTGAGACIAIHAEANALLDAGRRNCEGAVLYITCKPCDGCLRLIKAAGIKRVVWPDGELKKRDLYGTHDS